MIFNFQSKKIMNNKDIYDYLAYAGFIIMILTAFFIVFNKIRKKPIMEPIETIEGKMTITEDQHYITVREGKCIVSIPHDGEPEKTKVKAKKMLTKMNVAYAIVSTELKDRGLKGRGGKKFHLSFDYWLGEFHARNGKVNVSSKNLDELTRIVLDLPWEKIH